MSELKPGDRVKFLNDTGAGTVISVIDKNRVLVKTEDGFEYPCFKSDLILTEKISGNELKHNSSGEAELEKTLSGDSAIILPSVEQTVAGKMAQTYDKAINGDGKTRQKKKQNPVESRARIEEVDLHIHEIIDDYKNLTAGEILKSQLARFRTALEGAIRNRQSRIIFIHGQGAGKLKHELRKIIDNDYKNCIYQDASFKEYGFGATMIIIK